MPKSDRAFRALARSEPDILAGLLAVVAPGVLPRGVVLAPDDVAPTQIDGLPPELDADFAACVDAEELLHVECQGYRDGGFEPRTLWYHLGFALRYRGRRRVRTLALWLTTPPGGEARQKITVHDITVQVTAVVLHKVRASLLLADPRTVSFAAGAHREGRSTEELCGRVAAALKAKSASWAERHMAVVAAAMRGRYKAMVMAMEDANMEPVIIEDLVKFGEDRGLRRGLKKGRKEGLREGMQEGMRAEERRSLRRVLALRKLALCPEQEQQIDACTDIETLRRWLDQAVFAETAADALR